MHKSYHLGNETAFGLIFATPVNPFLFISEAASFEQIHSAISGLNSLAVQGTEAARLGRFAQTYLFP